MVSGTPWGGGEATQRLTWLNDRSQGGLYLAIKYHGVGWGEQQRDDETRRAGNPGDAG